MTNFLQSPLAKSIFYVDEDGFGVARSLLALAPLATTLTNNPKAIRVMSAVSTLSTVGTAVYQINARYRDYKARGKKTYDIEIEEGPIFDRLVELLRADIDPEEISSMRMGVKWVSDRRGGRDPKIQYTFSDQLDAVLMLAGHEVRVHKPVAPPTRGSGSSDTIAGGAGRGMQVKQNNYIILSCESDEARAEVSEFLEGLVEEMVKPKPSFYVGGKWGGFDRMSDIPQRPRDSVILKEGQMDRILNHLRSFLDQEDYYTQLGIPYRTGILLSGAPGSGKSSTASAIAFELGLDVYFISLSSIGSDDDLVSVMENLPPRSVLILEDIDIAKASKERSDDGKGGVTMSGLLNALDGFTSPHGVITLMTTNHLETMDPAVVRPGRVDLMEEITEIDNFQLRGICEHFLGFIPEGLPEVTVEDGITSASLVGILKKYIPNMGEAATEVVQFVQEKAKSFTK